MVIVYGMRCTSLVRSTAATPPHMELVNAQPGQPRTDCRVGASAEEGGGVVGDFAGCGFGANHCGRDGRDRVDPRAGDGVEHAEAGGAEHRERVDGAAGDAGGSSEDLGRDDGEAAGEDPEGSRGGAEAGAMRSRRRTAGRCTLRTWRFAGRGEGCGVKVTLRRGEEQFVGEARDSRARSRGWSWRRGPRWRRSRCAMVAS